MKKILTFWLIILVFNSPIFAEKTKLKPSLFINASMTGLYHQKDGPGLNLLGFDIALLKYKNIRFLDFGAGIAVLWRNKAKWVKCGYYYWTMTEDGTLETAFHVIKEGYYHYQRAYLDFYFKFSPIKIPLNITERMTNKVFLDLSIFSQDLRTIDGIMFGLSFSFDIFKQKVSTKEK